MWKRNREMEENARGVTAVSARGGGQTRENFGNGGDSGGRDKGRHSEEKRVSGNRGDVLGYPLVYGTVVCNDYQMVI